MKYIEYLKRIAAIFNGCDHEWELKDRIHEQNLRYGIDHWSEVYVCKKCGKHQTIELSGG